LRALAARDDQTLGTYHQRPARGMLQLDVSNPAPVRKVVSEFRPDVVFLTAALTAVDYCETHEQAAQQINIGGAAATALAAADVGAKLVFYSTEYVFDGTRGPYSEDDETSPQGAYARSKLGAEEAIQALLPDHLILRTTVVFDWDPNSKNFAMQVWERLSAGESMNVPDDQVGNPTLARYLADASIRLATTGARGIVNVVGKDRVPRSEFGVRLATALGADAGLIHPIATHELHQVAPRPLDAGLKTEKLTELLGEPPITLDDAIAKFVASARAN
jgi:dTDP-4-dehydrorhamnose reductase